VYPRYSFVVVSSELECDYVRKNLGLLGLLYHIMWGDQGGTLRIRLIMGGISMGLKKLSKASVELYVAKDNETVDKDSETHAKVIETGVTKLLRLKYIPSGQPQGTSSKALQSAIDFPDRDVEFTRNMSGLGLAPMMPWGTPVSSEPPLRAWDRACTFCRICTCATVERINLAKSSHALPSPHSCTSVSVTLSMVSADTSLTIFDTLQGDPQLPLNRNSARETERLRVWTNRTH